MENLIDKTKIELRLKKVIFERRKYLQTAVITVDFTK